MLFSENGLSRLTGSLSSLYAALYAVEPNAAGVGFDDDILCYSFRGGLRSDDRELLSQRRLDQLRSSRERFLDVVGAQLAAPVEAFTRSQVAFHVGLFEPEAEATTLLFGFEDHEGAPHPSDPDRVTHWSGEVRRRARALRREDVAVAEVKREVHALFRERRREQARRFAARPIAGQAPAGDR